MGNTSRCAPCPGCAFGRKVGRDGKDARCGLLYQMALQGGRTPRGNARDREEAGERETGLSGRLAGAAKKWHRQVVARRFLGYVVWPLPQGIASLRNHVPHVWTSGL